MVLAAFLLGLVAVVAATVLVVLRGLALWRQLKRTGGALSAEAARFEVRSARTERLLQEADTSNANLQAALARLEVSRARLQVLLDALDRARKKTRWLQAFLPVG